MIRAYFLIIRHYFLLCEHCKLYVIIHTCFIISIFQVIFWVIPLATQLIKFYDFLLFLCWTYFFCLIIKDESIKYFFPDKNEYRAGKISFEYENSEHFTDVSVVRAIILAHSYILSCFNTRSSIIVHDKIYNILYYNNAMYRF